ncbi:MAG: DUF4345 domain-containing protein [Silicimonas sp.]|nr:DUF4345 domain-containing protein [Silicimonas sp.]
MQLTRFQKITLGISGVTALAIGALITLTPHAFYASYGITLGQDPNLLNELRASDLQHIVLCLQVRLRAFERMMIRRHYS